MTQRYSFDEINQMGLGDLIHLMISTYDKPQPIYENESYMQDSEYFHACTRLNELFPGKEKIEIIGTEPR